MNLNANDMKGTAPDRLGIRPTPGMPHWSKEANDKRHRKAVSVAPAPSAPRAPRLTVGPCCKDTRYTVNRLPDGYVSKLDPAECRPWAAAVHG